MKKDPFAALYGLDQQLFRERDPQQDVESQPIATRPQKESTSTRVNERSRDRAKEPSSAKVHEPSSDRALEPSSQRTLEATWTRASTLRGADATHRPKERYSHDLFKDQSRWMNRVKLEIEEKYGRRVTGNEIVQLALDHLMTDYQRSKSKSTLIRALVNGENVTDGSIQSQAGVEGG